MPRRSPLPILHLEDDPGDAALIQATLENGGIACAITCVKSRAAFVTALKSGVARLILSDFSVPAFDGYAALELAHARRPEVPFILVSGTLGEELAIDSLKRGATDYVLKHRLSRLVPAVHRALQEARLGAERKLAATRLRQSNRKLRTLSRRLVEIQEAERRSLARELHDEIGQSLTGMQLNLQAMLRAPGTRAQAARLREALGVVDRVLEQVQAISLNLRPSILDDLGLEPALVWLAGRQAEPAGLKLTLRLEALPHRLAPMIETACFRVTQEALTNVVRHARARAVTVELTVSGGQLHLRVRDDGTGFEVAATRDKAVHGASLGLLSMEERAALAGGGLEYSSRPGAGTEVHAWFPLKWVPISHGAETP